MKTLILVDDQAVDRRCLPWSERDCTLVGKASTNEEALELIRQLLPDYSLIEIKLPAMDDRTLKNKLGDSVPCAILTAHQDLKDFKVSSAVEHPLRRHFIWQLLSSVYEKDNEIRQQAAELGICLEADAFVLILGQVDNVTRYKSKYSVKDHYLIECSMLDIIRESLTPVFPGQFELFPLEFGKFAILLLQQPSQSTEEIRNKCLQLERSIAGPLRFYLQISVTLAASGVLKSPSMIREGFIQAEKLFIYRFYQESSRSIFADGTPDFRPLTEPLRSELSGLSVSLHNKADSASTQKSLNSLYALLLLYRPEPGDVLAWLESLGSSLRRDSALPEWPAFSHIERLAEAMDQLRAWLRQRDAAYEAAEAASVRPEIARALHYIKQHLTRKLTINDIAHEAGLSPSHFSLLFKKEIGKSAIDYVLERRIELAKQYLREGKYRNYELAEMAGFAHYSYFSNTFKKYTGMRPNEYKNTLRMNIPL
ncbi:helix-turn-helix domain-containing protein [Paenibacillus sp. BK720]|uniref:helix-turn-helix domain-containing protein n=1 Tax=Paenibacillus sp. BK720 TaxID=2587092 RepID=UPI0014237B07|nr:helix-turn-helix domain-containing protein [Paenibacillus sp. BK720]NIK67253.1 two-component system response regulator YesN [Paenibacillus sp. BK720]